MLKNCQQSLWVWGVDCSRLLEFLVCLYHYKGVGVGGWKGELSWSDNCLRHDSLDLFPDSFSIASLPEAKSEAVWGYQGWNITFERFLKD